MRLTFLFVMFSLVISVYGQEDPYSQGREQKAIKTAYEILKVYYPENDLCVSDSIYDLEFRWFSRLVDENAKQDLDSYRKEKNFVYSYYSPVYSPVLSTLFRPETGVDYKYVVEFSEPYKGMIRCDILPIDRKIGMFGYPLLPMFLFRYDEDGEIYQMSKVVAHID